MNFERAAELTAVPDDRILEIYNALRPYRSTQAELLAIADDLEHRYQHDSVPPLFGKRPGCTSSVRNSKATINRGKHALYRWH